MIQGGSVEILDANGKVGEMPGKGEGMTDDMDAVQIVPLQLQIEGLHPTGEKIAKKDPVGGEIRVEKIAPFEGEVFEPKETLHREGEKPGNPRCFVTSHPEFRMASGEGNDQ